MEGFMMRSALAIVLFGALVACSDESPATTAAATTAGSGGASSSSTQSGPGGTSSAGGQTGSGGQGGSCIGVGVDSCPMPGCACEGVGLVPLVDMGAATYEGESGGLYGDGENAMPAAHQTAGVAIAESIEPLDASGDPDPDGSYVLISVGMSNTTQEFQQLLQLVEADSDKDPHLVVVDGAQGGQTASVWANPGAMVWSVLAQRLQQAGVTAQQVAVAWVKQANAGPSGSFPGYAQDLQADLQATAQNLHAAFPNIKIAYHSSRIYAGYATTALNPEPYAYQSAFSVRWLLLDQIGGSAELNFDPGAGAVQAPWLSWGPYLWGNGLEARCDGLTWACSDLANDGTHPSSAGREKVAEMLHQFLRTDATARLWYLASP
jgi:hypothetical protein